MKKVISFFLLFCLGVSQISFSTETGILKSDEWVSSVRKEYEEGKYAAFLETNKQKWIQEENSGKLDGFGKGVSEEVLAKSKEVMEPIQDRLEVLRKELDEALISIAAKDSTLSIAQIIQSACSQPEISDEQDTAWLTLFEMTFVNRPSDSSPYAQKVKEILGEYFQRAFLVERHFLMEKNPNEDELEQCRFVLQLEKFNALFAVQELQSEDDEKLSHMIQIAYDFFILSAPRTHDAFYLISLGNDRRQPSNDLEREVVDVMKSYSKQQKELFSSLHQF